MLQPARKLHGRIGIELLAFKRAGADGVLTYFARDAARMLLNR